MEVPQAGACIQALRASPISSHKLTPPRWGGKRTGFAGSRQATENPVRRFPPGAPSQGRGLVLCQWYVMGAESLGTQRRRSRYKIASFLGKEVAP